MDKKVVFNLISKSRENLIKISKAIRVDFEGVLKAYIIFENMDVKSALWRVSEDIVEEYADKLDIWDNVSKILE